jgi:Flp pilus assembly protein TadG
MRQSARIIAQVVQKSWNRFRKERNGNVAITFALAMIPLVYAVGMGVDYTSAAYREDQLNAYADSAALAAVTPTMMASTDAASVAAAQNTFNAQASTLSGITYNSSGGVTVTTVDTITTRTVTVSWTAASDNSFPNVLGSSTIALAGSSQAVGAIAPNINFYLLLDTSPSMAIAATQTGINTMVANTSSQGGCAFACHESNPSADGLGNPGGEDNYQLARNLGVTLRIDNLVTASENLATTAQTTETTNHASYEMSIYTFNTAATKVAPLTSSMTTVASDASTITMLEVYDNNNLTKTDANDDEDTDYDAAMTAVNTAMPNPGNGTNSKGDTPQEVLFFVTDGVEDEDVSGGRQQSLMSTSWCTTIKNRGIRIAVLYLEYLPLPTNSWYNTYISPFQPNIGSQLESCASPGLYYEVETGGDISAALTSLFQIAVQTSYLSK